MCTYSCPELYIQSSTDIVDKIKKIDLLIEALEASALKGAGKAHIEEYEINDGQSKIRNIYRDMEEVLKAIMVFESLRQMYINRLPGKRTMRLVDKYSNRLY